jgi:hypothetical protein
MLVNLRADRDCTMDTSRKHGVHGVVDVSKFDHRLAADVRRNVNPRCLLAQIYDVGKSRKPVCREETIT